MPSDLLKCSIESRNISPEAPFSHLFTPPAKLLFCWCRLKLVLQNLHCLPKAKILKFHFLWGESIRGMSTPRSTARKSWNKSCCLSTTPPQYQALVSSSQASTHAKKSMLCFPEPGGFTRRVNTGSKTFYMCHYTTQKNLLLTTEMRLDQRRSKRHRRTADKGVADNPR